MELETGEGCPICTHVCVRGLARIPWEWGTGCQTGVKHVIILLTASFCFPSRVGLMTALIMPDGSHQSSFNSRKMSKYCLQNWFAHSFSLF